MVVTGLILAFTGLLALPLFSWIAGMIVVLIGAAFVITGTYARV